MVLFFWRRGEWYMPDIILIEYFYKYSRVFSEMLLKIFKSDYLNLRGEYRCFAILNTIIKSVPVSSPIIRKSEENPDHIHKFRFLVNFGEIKKEHISKDYIFITSNIFSPYLSARLSFIPWIVLSSSIFLGRTLQISSKILLLKIQWSGKCSSSAKLFRISFKRG